LSALCIRWWEAHIHLSAEILVILTFGGAADDSSDAKYDKWNGYDQAQSQDRLWRPEGAQHRLGIAQEGQDQEGIEGAL
jgi:hypothetical protein